MPRSALLLGSVVAVSLLAPPGLVGEFGLASAAAATHYTRKKVNGRWVTGKFPKAEAGAAKEAAQPAAAGKTTRRVRFVERKGLARARYASLPKFKPKVVLKQTASVVASAASKPADSAIPAQTGSLTLSARTETSLPPDRVIATASITPALVVHPGAERMRAALQARAQMMAAALGAIAVPLPDAAPPAQLLARRVTFDLEKGERTIVFDDGAAVTAPFDQGRASDLTGLKPAAR